MKKRIRRDHFRVVLCLSFKASLGAQPFIFKRVPILMQIKLIFIGKVVLISFPDLAGGRTRRRDLVKSDLYHVIACQECGRQVNSACPGQF